MSAYNILFGVTLIVFALWPLTVWTISNYFKKSYPEEWQLGRDSSMMVKVFDDQYWMTHQAIALIFNRRYKGLNDKFISIRKSALRMLLLLISILGPIITYKVRLI